MTPLPIEKPAPTYILLEMDQRQPVRPEQHVLHHADEDRMRVERDDLGDPAIERGKSIGRTGAPVTRSFHAP